MAIWFRLKHRNILLFFGFVNNVGPTLSFVSPWLPNGSASAYLKTHPGSDRLQIVAALVYLKGEGVIHRDLKGTKVLISTGEGYPRPLLFDLGVSKVLSVGGTATATSESLP